MRKQLSKPKIVLLRFPLMFGGFLLLMGTGFYYREYFLSDIEEQRSQLVRNQNEETNSLLAEFIKEHKLRNTKP